jgi:hypothetical protein
MSIRACSLVLCVLLSGCEKVDAQTHVLARNVIVERSSRSALTSDDAQAAFEELSLDLRSTMVGTWDIVNKNIEPQHTATGQVRIDSAGTFSLLQGSFAAIGEGSSGFCSHMPGTETYEFLTPKLVVLRHTNQNTQNSVIPTVVELRQNTITFLGSGGCGQVGLQRISILTRVGGADGGTADGGP